MMGLEKIYLKIVPISWPNLEEVKKQGVKRIFDLNLIENFNKDSIICFRLSRECFIMVVASLAKMNNSSVISYQLCRPKFIPINIIPFYEDIKSSINLTLEEEEDVIYYIPTFRAGGDLGDSINLQILNFVKRQIYSKIREKA